MFKVPLQAPTRSTLISGVFKTTLNAKYSLYIRMLFSTVPKYVHQSADDMPFEYRNCSFKPSTLQSKASHFAELCTPANSISGRYFSLHFIFVAFFITLVQNYLWK